MARKIDLRKPIRLNAIGWKPRNVLRQGTQGSSTAGGQRGLSECKTSGCARFVYRISDAILMQQSHASVTIIAHLIRTGNANAALIIKLNLELRLHHQTISATIRIGVGKRMKPKEQ